MSTRADIERKIVQNREEAIALAAELLALPKYTPEQELAIQLHDSQCIHNHTDGCGWFYEFSNKKELWDGRDHQHWLGKARRLSAICSAHNVGVDDALTIINSLKGL
jgi:hypothetical protein